MKRLLTTVAAIITTATALADVGDDLYEAYKTSRTFSEFTNRANAIAEEAHRPVSTNSNVSVTATHWNKPDSIEGGGIPAFITSAGTPTWPDEYVFSSDSAPNRLAIEARIGRFSITKPFIRTEILTNWSESPTISLMDEGGSWHPFSKVERGVVTSNLFTEILHAGRTNKVVLESTNILTIKCYWEYSQPYSTSIKTNQ